jgi:5-methylcytosine-specific restriction endonuclease McrA
MADINSFARGMYNRLWRYANHDSYKTRMRTWEATWRKNNPDKVRDKNTKWRVENRQKSRDASRAWALRNKDRRCAYQMARKAKTKTNDAAVFKIYKKAQELRQWFDVQVDHVVPLSKGGSHTAENLQIIYAFENLMKSNNDNYRPRVIFI